MYVLSPLSYKYHILFYSPQYPSDIKQTRIITEHLKATVISNLSWNETSYIQSTYFGNHFCHISVSLHFLKSRNTKVFCFHFPTRVFTWQWHVLHEWLLWSSSQLQNSTDSYWVPFLSNWDQSRKIHLPCPTAKIQTVVLHSYHLWCYWESKSRKCSPRSGLSAEDGEARTSEPPALLFPGDRSLVDALLLGVHLLTAVHVTGLSSPRKSFHCRNLRGFQATKGFHYKKKRGEWEGGVPPRNTMAHAGYQHPWGGGGKQTQYERVRWEYKKKENSAF